MKNGFLMPGIVCARASLAVLVACATVLASLIAAAPSDAAWRGTPGKIAYFERDSGEFDLRVWTPRLHTGTAVTVHQDTFHFQEADDTVPFTIGTPSAPAWSPDGTKLAYAAKIPDNGIGNGATHTAIFVWDVRSGDVTRVTTPPDGKVDPNPGDALQEGFEHADFAPAWSPDGQSLVYIRLIGAGKDEPIYAQRGGNVRKVSLTGGGATELTHLYGEQAFWSLSWGGDPAGQSRLVGYHSNQTTGFRLVTIDPNSGATTTLQSGNSAAMITDFDVTADGLGVDYVRADGTGDRRRFDGPTSPLGSGLRINAFRSSPSGNGPLHANQATIPGVGPRIGIVERRAPDPDGDVWPEEPLDRWVNAFFGELFGKYAIGTPGRSTWDIQAQQLPIINIPGFAGSDILCDGETQWPPGTFGNAERLQNMQLGEDGRTNVGCAGAGPTQDPNDDEGFVSSAFSQDIYQAQEDWIDQIAPGDRGWRFSWDWRKAPSQSLARLDTLINRALQTDFAEEQDAKRVVLYGHSYGGLLMREYVQGHPEKVARTLTAGTPYWGVPKPMFFVGFGVENPVGGLADLDSFIPNAEGKQFARNAAGAYHLFPGDRYGRWMTTGGTFQDIAQTRAWLTGIVGANGGLLDEARAWHQQHDGFTTMQGTIEARAVVGTGLLSIGGVDVPAGPAEDGTIETRIRMVDGDITVPIQSAHQGPLGTHTPLGDPVHVQAVCKVSHMDLGGHPDVTEKYTEFLLTGRTPRKTEGPCKPSGTVLEIREFEIPSLGARVFGPVARAALDPTASLVDAAEAGDIQLIEVPGAPIAVLSDDKPVNVQLAGGDRRVNLRVTRYDEGEVTSTSTFSNLSGDVRAASGAGGALTVTKDGQVVGPDGPGPGGPTDPGPTDPGGGGGATGGGPAGPGSTLATARVRFTKVRAERRGRWRVLIAISGRLTGPSTGRVTITAKGGKLRGRGGVAVRGGAFKATLKLRGALPRRVTVVARYAGSSTYTPARASRGVAIRRQ